MFLTLRAGREKCEGDAAIGVIPRCLMADIVQIPPVGVCMATPFHWCCDLAPMETIDVCQGISRWRRAPLHASLVSDGVAALNALEAWSARGVGSAGRSSPNGLPRTGPSTQSAVLNFLGRALVFPQPNEHDLRLDGALCELLRSKDLSR